MVRNEFVKYVFRFAGFLVLLILIKVFTNMSSSVKIKIYSFSLFIVGEIIFLLSVRYLWSQTSKIINCYQLKIKPKFVITIIFFSVVFFANLSFLFFAFKVYIFFSPLCYVFLGFYLTFFVSFFLVHGLLSLFINKLLRCFVEYENPSRVCSKLMSYTYFTFLATSIVFTIYGCWNAYREPTQITINLNITHLPFSKFTILVLSDLHLGNTVNKHRIQNVVNLSKKLNYDMVVIVGDLTDLPSTCIEDQLSPLKSLQPSYGTYFVTGNHEIYTGDVAGVVEYLEQNLNIRVLRNEKVKVYKKQLPNVGHSNASEDYFYLMGVDEYEFSRFRVEGFYPNYTETLNNRNENHSSILLVHQPKAAKHIIDNFNNVDLIISGHTHGGQFFPFNLIVFMANPFFRGLYHVNNGGYHRNTYVYVSQGTFYWGIPIRTFSRSEITLINLLNDKISSKNG